MQTRGARLARGTVAALAATATAAASHTFADTQTPPPAILAIAAAFATLICVFLSGRYLSLSRLSISVLASQLAYHALFHIAGGATEVKVTGNGKLLSDRHNHGAATVELFSGGGSVSGPGHADHSPVMILAHLTAAVLTIAMLRHGERIFWTLGAGAARVVVRLVARASALLLPSRPGIATLGTVEPLTPHALETVLSALQHRGPPPRVLRAV
ncbi:hypothetical protein C5C66_01940 [Rathayibacter toxicus]|uniref:hypothetical protein n=1 Tax=Rathayibacter toxicus TaxID=145458 RepID=UPI0006973A2A|nr:hypothetical protein [Rathayibacter toxicus]ALS57092.1 hypothetical protein APU90_04345 [Rathayibacter toxicus]PPG23031.1 hypothetical protein C5D15_01915 [Rathayibacter toxicus]PPG47613.1 hypothetical protein C5D16_01910 [Rathayibacter toxicus]PPH64485.1 hypothetical protein C5D13_01960 [Rathayibacter toxicus]PPH68677.1 hypothetical protein C5D01_01950 [Rathayibacter toxicus]